jgi:hypothetical protein
MIAYIVDHERVRPVAEWCEVKRRVECPATIAPAYFDAKRARTVPARHLRATAFVERYSADRGARRYAAEHGEAIVWYADDTFRVYTRAEDGKVRTKVIRNARIEVPLPSGPSHLA